MALFIPELICEKVYDIPTEFFIENNAKLLILDIDNTLVTYDDEFPTEKNLEWFESLKSLGIETAFVSNNSYERVSLYAKELGCVFVADAKKPFCFGHKKIASQLGVSPKECICVGDQILTDILAAHLFGSFAVLVSPIKDKTDAFMRFKRKIEKLFVNTYHKKQKGRKENE